MTTPLDPRAVATYRIPARSLKPGDLVNTAPGGEDDWQQVVSVQGPDSPGANSADLNTLIASVGDRYVFVEMTDVAPVDSNVYFDDGVAMVYANDDGDDVTVEEIVSEPNARRNYLYTVFELVTVRLG
jgi:hypothetical protein